MPGCVLAVLELAIARSVRSGPTLRLAKEAGAGDVRPDTLGKSLAQHAAFLADRGVTYRRERTRRGSVVTLEADSRCRCGRCDTSPDAPPAPATPATRATYATTPTGQQALPGL